MFPQLFQLLLVFLGLATCGELSEIPSVNTTSGIFQGFSPYPSIHAYLGMPFAKAPIQDLRFEPPEPLISNDEKVIDASLPFAGCFQVLYNTALADKNTGIRESEDCLFINVWKHETYTGKKARPVLVWIYGGGFSQGASQPTDGISLVEEHEDIIVVSFNYRINIFGFPNSPAIKHKNLGLLDQRLAIEWIRDNIHAFGGDPNRITLMGQSAGSISLSYYAFAYTDDPIANGLIELSGQPESNPPEVGLSWSKVANFTECANETSLDSELACMKRQPARHLKRGVSLSNFINYGDLSGGGPSVDNVTVFTNDEYVARGMAGRFAKIPLWASHCLNEGDNLVEFNPFSANPINYTLSDFITLAAFQCPTFLATQYRVGNGVPVYRSVYSGEFPAVTPYPWMRAYHAADIYLTFGADQTLSWEDPTLQVKEAGRYMRSAIAAFVRDPRDGLKNFGWPNYNATGSTLVNLFANNTANATFEDVKQFDAICQSLYGQ